MAERQGTAFEGMTGREPYASAGSLPEVSVVIPFYNEEGNVVPLVDNVTKELTAAGAAFEIVAIDDGSTDGTFDRLREAHERNGHLRIVTFRRNFGQTAALSAGMDYARGSIIITMDGDQQNDPRDLPLLVAKIREGYDIVSGWRRERKERFWSRRVPSRIANALISRISRVRLHDYGCTLKAYRREVVKNLHLYGEMHRFIPAIASAMGVRITEVGVRDHPRVSGRSKYGLSRTYKVVLDLLTLKLMLTFFHRPMLLFGGIGTLSALAGAALFIYALIVKFGFNQPLANRPLLTVVPSFLILFGIILVLFGFQAEMNMRIYYESQRKPIYVIREIIE